MMSRIPESEVSQWLAKVPEWRREGGEIVRGFTFRNFREALAFVVQVGMLAERMDHHPDITIRYKQVELRLITHSAGGLTEKDFELAQQIDALVS
ncbi:MAG: 4a-hydroxytetrahydrobiopterin dehydratase [Fimbriimonadales bacterium]|jgi:4a-hydroxytetrahydrobiopterin dehydratase|nr:4a-hydroxytetrahydrobiopterin dehydratase [Fimbriimonadales bacterium]GBC89951.1 Putative pterin-4-alpha-carbinolamine dehydratase [bacterium HR14]CUU03432.1 4a-hydroxytetrahydrobiopterin dehydratase [Armatimonadetes bacterium GBS]